MSIHPGDLFLLGPHRLLCGNAENSSHFEKLMGGDFASMVFTDPPYNVGYAPRRGGGKRVDKSRLIENDDLCKKCFEGLLDKSLSNLLNWCKGAFYICMSSKEFPKLLKLFEEKGGIFSSLLIAVKSHFSLSWADYHPRHELILYGWNEKPYWCGSRKEHTLLDFKVAPNKLHPTMKPVDLIEKTIINSSREGDIVLDPFAGSGSTIIAAHNQNRIGYAIEVSGVYCQTIIDRFEAHTGIKAQKVQC
jgi:DNA modification methylase